MLHEFQNMRKDDCNEVWNTMTMLAMPYADEIVGIKFTEQDQTYITQRSCISLSTSLEHDGDSWRCITVKVAFQLRSWIPHHPIYHLSSGSRLSKGAVSSDESRSTLEIHVVGNVEASFRCWSVNLSLIRENISPGILAISYADLLVCLQDTVSTWMSPRVLIALGPLSYVRSKSFDVWWAHIYIAWGSGISCSVHTVVFIQTHAPSRILEGYDAFLAVDSSTHTPYVTPGHCINLPIWTWLNKSNILQAMPPPHSIWCSCPISVFSLTSLHAHSPSPTQAEPAAIVQLFSLNTYYCFHSFYWSE